MKKTLFCILSALLLPAVATAAPTVRRRGNFLRTEIRDAMTERDFQFQPLPRSGSFLAFLFREVQRTSYTEVKVYEVVEETTKINEGEGITPQGAVELTVVPGLVMEGESTPQQQTAIKGPFGNQTFLFLGREITTDENGIWVDDTQFILEHFDTLANTPLEITASLPDGKPQSLTLTRQLLRQPKGQAVIPDISTKPAADILETLGLDFTREITPSGAEISIEADCPETAEAEGYQGITLSVKNEGDKDVRNLFGCIFSSEPTLNGKLFYFGRIAPGKSASFSRVLQMPKRAGETFVTFAFWSILGPVPDQRISRKILIRPKAEK